MSLPLPSETIIAGTNPFGMLATISTPASTTESAIFGVDAPSRTYDGSRLCYPARKISRNVQESARVIVNLASSMMEVNHRAIETGSPSSHVLVASQERPHQGSRMKFQVDTVLATVPSA